ncbi:hypothetical protein BLNAU_16864 [Blattamonas nauphoetae]|uniref:Uncharacterized protein n=1 Tax=Blattamonas nauphoetae TaxID=2049346 RepID=A0ABQ9XA98_9EUKA|nr:hypothetical protein BLNAU_16864 [Blattamonas nauphoetae]
MSPIRLAKSTSSRGFVGKEGNYPIPVPLSLFFLPLPISTFVSSDSCDVSVCGFSEYPCSSLSFLNSRIGSTPDTQITFNTNLEHSGELSLSERLTVIGSNNEMTIKETALSETNTALFTIPPVRRSHHCRSCFHRTSNIRVFCNANQARLKCGIAPQPRRASTHPVHSDPDSFRFESPHEHDFFNSINSSNEKAGVILTVLTESTSFLLHNNTFTSCTCSGQANAIFLELVNTTAVQADSFDYLMTDLVFDSPSSNTDTKIKIDVFVVGNNLDKTMTSTKWDNSFSREKGSSLGERTQQQASTSLLPYLVALEGPVEIDDDGKGFEKCGHFFLFCNSLELGLRRMKEASVDTMKVMERITATTPIEPQCDLCVEGNDELSSLSFSLNGCFINSPKDATPSTLLLVSRHRHPIRINTPDPHPIPSPSLIALTTGELLFSSHTPRKSIVLQSTPLIASSGSITMTNCNFTSISRVDGLGCVLEASGTPTWILLNGKNPNTVRLSNWEGTLSPSSPRPSVLLFIPTDSNDPPFSTDPSNPHSLLYEFYPRDPTMIVVRKNDVSEDHPLCGSSQLPCLTIDKSVGLTKVRTVEIIGEGEISSVMKLDGDLLGLGGHKKEGTVQMKEGGQFMNNLFDDPDTLHLFHHTGRLIVDSDNV